MISTQNLPLTSLAPAKINLYLHVTGRREDGYHLLDSLVGFADIGDEVTLEEADSFSFEMTGPMAAELEEEDTERNLAVRAARALARELGRHLNYKISLDKRLPVASGIGGGSTDAAAVLRLLGSVWGIEANNPILHKIAAGLGQDVPCCLEAKSCFFRGIGDEMASAPTLPSTDIVLVNPRKSVPTPAVFKARQGPFTPAAAPITGPIETAHALAEALLPLQNSLSEAAQELCPEIEAVLTGLASQEDCLLSRMSGSGATCFGLFSTQNTARQAAMRLSESHPDWWVVPGRLTGDLF